MMMRQAVRGLVVVAALAALVGASGAQPASLDKVYVRDKKDGSTKTYDGTLKFGPGGFQVVGAKDKVLAAVAPEDLIKYVPGEMPGLDRATVLGLVAMEDKGTKAEYEKAQLGYAELRKKLGAGGAEPARRYVDYKYALVSTRVADESGDDERWAESAAAAVKEWGTFLGEYKTGWELWPATQASARLLAELNKYDEAARLWARTAKVADLPADLKLEASLRALDAEIRGGGHASAVVTAGELGKAAGPGTAKDKLAIYELAAKAAPDALAKRDYSGVVKQIEEAVAKAKDPTVRGAGYGMIGELHLMAGKPREAMWAFLWVETVYGQDKHDVLKAMCRLAEAFKAQADEDRARSYREKIRRLRDAF
jgi:hypothetical protein